MNQIDEIYTEFPYYGSPRIVAELARRKHPENHKRVERLMRVMGIQALYPRPKTSVPQPMHRKYPYLLKGLSILRPDQVWGTDITYIRAQGMWFYLVAIMDWFSRYVLSWRLSDTMAVSSCVATLEEALMTSVPEVHNSDQGSQFTAADYLEVIERHPSIQISMDGRGRCFDNIFTERLWRTVKYEEVYVKEYRSGSEARASLGDYFAAYNTRRLHSSLNYKTPAEVYFGRS